MRKLKSLELKQILYDYELPPRLVVYFAALCAKDALTLLKNPDPRSIDAVKVAERYGLGEEVSIVERFAAESAAWSVVYHSVDVRLCVQESAFYAIRAAPRPDLTPNGNRLCAYTACATAAAGNGDRSDQSKKMKEYKKLLITLIDQRLSEVEKVLIFKD